MDDPIDRGLPFELSQPWARSTFTSYTSVDDFLFDKLDVDPSLLELGQEHDKLSDNEPFTIPELGEIGPDNINLEKIDSDKFSIPSHEDSLVGNTNEPEAQPDIWNLDTDLSDEQNKPLLKTWEAFENKSLSTAQEGCLLSEAGTGAFDAAVALSPHGEDCQGVLPQDVLLRAYRTLVLGRSSIFFHWDHNKRCFSPTLSDVPMSGLTPLASGSIAAQLMRHGSLVRQLYDYSTSFVSKKTHTAAETAFKQSVMSVLDGLEAGLSPQIFQCRSVLQLQQVLNTPREIIETMQKLSEAIHGSRTEEEAISALSDHVQAVAEAGSDIAGLLRAILTRVCAPWIQRLAHDLGLAGNAEHHQPMINDEATSAKDTLEVHPQSDDGRMSFVDPKDRNRIEETKASLKILRKHLPSFASDTVRGLCETKHGVSSLPIEAMGCISTTNNGDDPEIAFVSDASLDHGPWNTELAHGEYLGVLEARISDHPETAHLLSDPELHSVTVSIVEPRQKMPDKSATPEYMVGFNPLDELRPLIQAQALRLNGILLRYIFRSCHLRKHLDLQRDFHLFGNSEFITRFSTALFSSEVQTARRTRGTVPTSEIMGLRLSAKEDQRWPPASSELRLALADVLTDSYRERHPVRDHEKIKLPGGLGFTIRELTDEEIERTMDPGSIYALDFLKLEYTAPPPLDAVLTFSSLLKYDEIFRFMLKMIRSQYTITRLRSASSSSPDHGNGATAHFPIEAHHMVSTLMIYFMDIGIDAPWKGLMGRLENLEKTMSNEDDNDGSVKTASVGISYLRESHDGCLEAIRERLFLKRKQQKVRDAIEEVLSAVLHAAAAMGTGEMDQKISSFRVAASELVKLLQTTADRPPKTHSPGEWVEMETEPVKLLLGALNWNDYY